VNKIRKIVLALLLTKQERQEVRAAFTTRLVYYHDRFHAPMNEVRATERVRDLF
jgi:hypothetical protein